MISWISQYRIYIVKRGCFECGELSALQRSIIAMNASHNGHRRALSTSDDDVAVNAETGGLINTLYINLILFVVLMIFFEANRHLKLIYLKRLTRKFQVRFGKT